MRFFVSECVCVCVCVCCVTHLTVPINVVHVAPLTVRVLSVVVVTACPVVDGDTSPARHFTRLLHDINCQSRHLPSLLVSGKLQFTTCHWNHSNRYIATFSRQQVSLKFVIRVLRLLYGSSWMTPDPNILILQSIAELTVPSRDLQVGQTIITI